MEKLAGTFFVNDFLKVFPADFYEIQLNLVIFKASIDLLPGPLKCKCSVHYRKINYATDSEMPKAKNIETLNCHLSQRAGWSGASSS
jgi:hypothetical protein